MDSYEEVMALLPPELRRFGESLPPLIRRRAEEVHLRAGRPPTVTVGGDELPLPCGRAVSRRDLELTVEIATQASAHAAVERVRQGYFTVRGGHRIGLCGSVAVEDGQVKNLRRLSSLNLRIAHEARGCGEEVLPALFRNEEFQSTLIIAPPGQGKTTLLRDLIRLLSNGFCAPARRVGLADERGEVAALWEGIPQFDVGERTDVLDGCPKALGLMMLLRGMNPQVLCCDEITAREDCEALEQCANCGVRLLATAHARDIQDLVKKPLYRQLLERGIFEKAVTISRREDSWYQVRDLPC